MNRVAISYFLVMTLAPASLLLGKEKGPDARLRKIYTVYVKDEHNMASQAAQANLEKWTCFKSVSDRRSADAIISVLWSEETLALPDYALSQTGAHEPVPTAGNVEYHTTVIFSIREGSKFKKIWSRRISLGERDEQKKSGVSSLMKILKTEAWCQSGPRSSARLRVPAAISCRPCAWESWVDPAVCSP